MRLKKISLINFRCFQKLEINLHPRLTVFVGENGAGKTAILDGIAAGLSPILRHLSSANQRLSAKNVGIKDSDFRIDILENNNDKVRWVLTDYAQVIVETTDGMQWDYWRPSKNGKKPPVKIGESELAYYLARVSESFITSKPEPLPVFAYYGAQRGRIEIPENLRSSTDNYGYPTSALVNSLDSSSNFKEMLKWFNIEEAGEFRANRNRKQGDYGQSSALNTVREAINILLGGNYNNPFFNDDHKFVLQSIEGGKPLQVSQLSQGYQSMLALGMDFARRLALAKGQLINYIFEKDGLWDIYNNPVLMDAIMLVDEIDLHLHPSWQQRVLGDLMRTFPNTQFIVTTHSPQVLTTVPSESIRVLHNELNSDTGQLESWLEIPEQQTCGVSSADVLASAMATDPVPDVRESAWLRQYRALIQHGLQDSVDGLELRGKLLGHFGDRHPEILDCERMIRLEAFKRKLPPLGKSTSAGL
jgi:predicted ATP-binding protein involved in virulence